MSRDSENLLPLVDVALFKFNFFSGKDNFGILSPFGPVISPDEETAQIYQVTSTSGIMNFGVLRSSVSMHNCP